MLLSSVKQQNDFSEHQNKDLCESETSEVIILCGSHVCATHDQLGMSQELTGTAHSPDTFYLPDIFLEVRFKKICCYVNEQKS